MTWISITVLLAASICFNGWRILEERETQAACEGTTVTPHIAAGPRSLMIRRQPRRTKDDGLAADVAARISRMAIAALSWSTACELGAVSDVANHPAAGLRDADHHLAGRYS
jgi:hypothetical protein